MADDTISKIKLRLNNNLRSQQSLSSKVAALSNRMSATDYSPCNDFFANCCNCCGPECSCCPCLTGFYLTASGWKDGNCGDCEEFNGTWYIPLTIDPNTSEIGATCSKLGDYSFQFLACNKYSIMWTWVLSCVNGQLQIEITQEIGGQDNIGKDILHGFAYNLDCNDLSGTVLLENTDSVGNECDPSEATLSFLAVLGGPGSPTECQCCRQERCEPDTVNCLNPFPDTLTLTLDDNCGGSRNITLSRTTDFGEGLCWTGLYNVTCIECEFGYRIGVMFCCDNGDWSLFFTPVNNYDDIIWDNVFEGYGTREDSDHLMIFDSCDPISAHSDELFCKTATVNCPGPISALYCVNSFTITE